MFKTVVKMTAVFLFLKVDTVSLLRYDHMVDDTVSLDRKENSDANQYF